MSLFLTTCQFVLIHDMLWDMHVWCNSNRMTECHCIWLWIQHQITWSMVKFRWLDDQYYSFDVEVTINIEFIFLVYHMNVAISENSYQFHDAVHVDVFVVTLYLWNRNWCHCFWQHVNSSLSMTCCEICMYDAIVIEWQSAIVYGYGYNTRLHEVWWNFDDLMINITVLTSKLP